MASLLQDFGQTAQRLARNPLGIIALFIVLVYGIAGLVLGISSGNLEPVERQPLVWFLVVFPLIVLGVFYRLVTAHHIKLYAPHDFPDAEGFFRALTPSEQRERLEQELRELEAELEPSDGGEATAVEIEGTGFVKTLPTRHAWVLAEEFAFRELESEFGTSIQRQVAVANNYGVDGVFVEGGKPRFVEIKFTKQPRLLHAFHRGVGQLQRIADKFKRASFVLVIVTDGVAKEQLEAELAKMQDRLNSEPFRIALRVYDFDELKKKYGVG